MEFLQVVKKVKEYLKTLSLEEKAILFKTLFQSPIEYKDGVFYLSDKEYTLNRTSDYFEIREHWMSMHEFDKLYEYIQNKIQKE